MPTITNDHKYYVDLCDDTDFDISNIVSVYPESLQFSEAIRGAGDISFQLTYSAEDQDGDTIASYGRDFIGPYRSYWRLRYGDTSIMAGVITITNSKIGSSFMSITGKTWERFPEIWEYPFDPRVTPHDDVDHTQDFQFPNTFQNNELIGSGDPLGGTGLAYQAYNRDVISIFSDIFVETMNVPNRVIFDVSRLADLSGVRTNYNLALGDNTKMDSFISGLAETGDGFDWWVSQDKQIYWASPYRYGNPSSPSIFYYVGDDDLATGFLTGAEFSNLGPASTHVFGQGSGLASQTRLGRAYGYSAAQTEFSRYDESYDFGDVRNYDQLAKKTHKQLALNLNPQHEIPLTFDPKFYPTTGPRGYWRDFRKGRAIWVTLDFGYHLVDSAQQLTSYQATMDNTGNVLVNWTIAQIYNTSSTVGTAEG